MIDMQKARDLLPKFKLMTEERIPDETEYLGLEYKTLRSALDEIDRLRVVLIEERAFSMSAAASCPGGSPDCYGIDWDKIGEDAARKTLEKEGKI